MGLAASQARTLMLVNRKADLIYRGQTIQSRRLALAYKTEQVSAKYSQAISNKTWQMKLQAADGSEDWYDITAKDMLNYSPSDPLQGFIFLDSSGNPLTNLYDVEMQNGQITNIRLKEGADRKISDDDLQRYLSTGQVCISTAANYNAWKSTDAASRPSMPTVIDPRSDVSDTFTENYDESDDEAATAEYEYETSQINTQDKKLELELKNIETQEKAVETEMESVNKVIEKNVQTTFKTFG